MTRSKNISEKLAYFQHIKDLGFETSKVLERENIKEIKTRLSMNRIDEHKMKKLRRAKILMIFRLK